MGRAIPARPNDSSRGGSIPAIHTPENISISITADSGSDLGSLCARLTFSFFILKNFHPIYPNVTRRAFQGIAHCKIVGIAQASDSSRVNCTRHKLQIKSFALQRAGVNCTLISELQCNSCTTWSRSIAQEFRHSTKLKLHIKILQLEQCLAQLQTKALQ